MKQISYKYKNPEIAHVLSVWIRRKNTPQLTETVEKKRESCRQKPTGASIGGKERCEKATGHGDAGIWKYDHGRR